MKHLLLFSLISISLSTTSCIKYVNLLSYQQEADAQRDLYLKNDYKLRPNDMLSVKLYEPDGTTMQTAGEVIQSGAAANQMMNAAILYFTGYKVSDSGYVELPFVNSIKAEGYTVDELEIVVNQEYQKLSRYGYYRIRLANMKVTVSGEVFRPGIQYVYDTRFTLIQAITQAGDFTPTANRSRVVVLREIEGKSQTFVLDLSKTDFISSPAYFLQPYDVIYIEPLKAKALNVNSGTISVIISSISIFLAVTTAVITISRR